MTRTRLALVVAGAVVGLAVIGLLVGFSSPSAPATAPALFDLDGVRALATARGGALPERIDIATVGLLDAPLALSSAYAGTGFVEMPLTSVRVQYPDHSDVIDAACNESAQHAKFPGSKFDPEAYRRVGSALLAAQTIVFTHEHFDHTQTLADSPAYDTLATSVWMPKAQWDNAAELRESGIDDAKHALLRSMTVSGPTRVDDGLVAIPAPGHTPGSQLLYVALQNGSEFLFIGDVAWNRAAIDRLKGKPRLLQAFLGEDGAAVAAQLRFLKDFEAAHPEVHVVPAHDAEVLAELIASGAVGTF